jgi:hypothetical protein
VGRVKPHGCAFSIYSPGLKQWWQWCFMTEAPPARGPRDTDSKELWKEIMLPERWARQEKSSAPIYRPGIVHFTDSEDQTPTVDEMIEYLESVLHLA